jgi:hypothetical protein
MIAERAGACAQMLSSDKFTSRKVNRAKYLCGGINGEN